MGATADKDMELWRQWKKKPSDAHAMALLHQVNPMIQKEVNRWAGTLARPAIELEAKRLAMEAMSTYQPTRGAAVGTHMMNRLRKLSRLPYTHQNAARMPEYQTLKFHTHNLAKAALEDKLGRSPTIDELSSELSWPKPYLADFQKSLRQESIESGTPAPIFDIDNGASGTIDFVYNDLNTQQKKLFQYSTGYGGAKILTNPQIMKKLKMTQGQLSYLKRKLIDHVSAATGGGVS